MMTDEQMKAEQERLIEEEISRRMGIFDSLVAAGAFEVRNGHIEAHFDASGALRKVVRHDTLPMKGA